MKTETPADLLALINRNAKRYDEALAQGDTPAAQALAGECAALFGRLARKVPLREQEYRAKADAWVKKGKDPALAGMIGDEAIPQAGPGSAARVPPKKPRHRVFISYSRPDAEVAQALCAFLEGEGIICWIAPRDVVPGTDFPASIIDAIDACSIVVLVFSASSDRSPHVIRELTRAVSQNRMILPFRIQDILPSKNMTYLINVSHWFEAFPPPAQQYFLALAETIRAHLSQEPDGVPFDGRRG